MVYTNKIKPNKTRTEMALSSVNEEAIHGNLIYQVRQSTVLSYEKHEYCEKQRGS